MIKKTEAVTDFQKYNQLIKQCTTTKNVGVCMNPESLLTELRNLSSQLREFLQLLSKTPSQHFVTNTLLRELKEIEELYGVEISKEAQALVMACKQVLAEFVAPLAKPASPIDERPKFLYKFSSEFRQHKTSVNALLKTFPGLCLLPLLVHQLQNMVSNGIGISHQPTALQLQTFFDALHDAHQELASNKALILQRDKKFAEIFTLIENSVAEAKAKNFLKAAVKEIDLVVMDFPIDDDTVEGMEQSFWRSVTEENDMKLTP